MYIYREVVPLPVRLKISHIRKKVLYSGFARYCPACERHSSQFLDFDLKPLHVEDGIVPPIVVRDTICPWCYSHLHHRLMWTVLPDLLKQLTTIPDDNRKKLILHFAPEEFSIPRLGNLQNVHYVMTDYMRRNVHVQFDMCELGLADQCIDLVIASHVLEHVPNDIAALKELYRVLQPGGFVVLLVPLFARQSYEYDNITSETDRLRVYGQADHVRAYGLDLSERIASCGFSVEVIKARDFPGLNHPGYFLDIQGVLFLARKPMDETTLGEESAS